MRLLSFLVALASVSSEVFLVNAIPQANPKCQKNACLSAVQSNRHHTNHAEWLPGCTSFFRRTVTPAIATSTIVTTVPSTTTKVVTKTDVRTVRVTATKKTTKTVHSTKTVATVTVTARASIPVRLMPRDADAELVTRAEEVVCPTTRAGPSKLPSYAAACQNTVAYSSACSCVGVTHGVTTIPRCTTTARVTRTRTVTATSTRHVAATSTITVATITQTSTTTVTDRVTATITVCAQPTNVNFLLNSLDGTIKNGKLKQGTLLGQDLGILTQLLGAGSGVVVSLDGNGHLITGDGKELGVLSILGGTSIRLLPIGGGLLGKYILPTCRVGPFPDCSRLHCDLGNGRNKFAYCSGLTEDLGSGLQIVAGLPLLGNCKYVNVTLAGV